MSPKNCAPFKDNSKTENSIPNTRENQIPTWRNIQLDARAVAQCRLYRTFSVTQYSIGAPGEIAMGEYSSWLAKQVGKVLGKVISQ